MTPNKCSKAYHKQVIEQKNQWLDMYFPSIKKRIYQKYGNNKKHSKFAVFFFFKITITA